MAKNLILLRGHPGSGKTTFAELIAPDSNYSADDYFMIDGEYKYNPRHIPAAHENCLSNAVVAMAFDAPVIAIHNTFIELKWMAPYFAVAKQYGYRVTVLHVEGDHGTIHEVPKETIARMKKRFQPYV